MKKRRKILSLLLAVCLVAGLLPQAAFAAGTDTGKAIQLVDSGTAANISGGQASSVYFGTYKQSSDGSGGYNIDPIKWRVLENADKELFLLSDQNLDVFEYHKEYESLTWETSTMRSWLNGYDASKNTGGDNGIDYADNNFLDNAFSAKEQTAIADTKVVNEDNPDSGTEGGNNTTDKMFLLSIAEANNSSYFADNSSRISTNTAYVAGGGEIDSNNIYGVGEDDYWWLRSPGGINNFAADVDRDGGVISYGHIVLSDFYAVRPAFNLDLNSVLFTSAAEGGKAARDMDAGLAAVGEYAGNEWKLTLLDESRKFAVTEEVASGKPGDTVTFNYTGATIGTNEYISAMIEDNGVVTHYGRIAQPNATEGQIEIKIPPSLAAGTYTLHVFSEQYNGGANDDTKLTDYASAFEAVTFTVVDTTAPPTPPIVITYYDITADQPEHGTITLEHDRIYRYGDVDVTLTAEEGYEVKDLLINGVSVGAVSSYTIEDVTEDIHVTAVFGETEAAKNERIAKGVENTTIRMYYKKDEIGKGWIKVRYKKSFGFKVDNYEIFRSVKKNTSFGEKPFFVTKKNNVSGFYKNTKNVKKGVRHYYKMRGVREIAGETYYTQWSNLVMRTGR